MGIKNGLKRLIPRQRELPGWIGGARMLVSRIGVYLAYVNWLMLSIIFWSSSPLVRSIFLNSYLLFLFLGLGGVVAVALLIEWVLVLPSEVRFTQNQWAKGNRSPLYSQLVETRKSVGRLEREVSKLREELKNARPRAEEKACAS